MTMGEIAVSRDGGRYERCWVLVWGRALRSPTRAAAMAHIVLPESRGNESTLGSSRTRRFQK